MAGTREELLVQLQNWTCNPQRPILWLSGMAGTGKSTIARTMARRLCTQKKLAGSFFFSRGVGDLGKATKFVSTLAHQLANMSAPGTSPSVKELVCDAIFENSNVLAQGLRNQWKELIVGPLSRLGSTQLALTLVVDALDECNSEDDIRLILQLFIELKNISNIEVSVLITSRPEITLLHGFQDLPEIMHRRLDLRDIPRDVVDHDIYVYMKEKLGQIKSSSKDWPSERDLESLVQKAGCLFIYAATVCRFIGKGYDVPEDCVSNILLNRPSGDGHTAALDAMYTQILSSALAEPGQYRAMTEWLTDRFKEVVGSIVVLLDMLSVTALGGLLSMKVEAVKITLSTLESVLDIPSDTEKPVRLLHPSFRDFLLDEARCDDNRFHVPRETAHMHLALRCLDVLWEGLRRNICNLESPESSPQEVSRDTLDHNLPSHVQYACQYWIEHLACASPQQSNQLGLYDDGKVHRFFKEHFLYWLEAMSIMGRMPETVYMMERLSAMLKSNEHPILHAIVKDAERFLLRNRAILQQAPLQTYASALVFSPRQSQIREQYHAQYPRWFKGGPVIEDNWGLTLQTLDFNEYTSFGNFHDHGVWRLAAFSSDGKYLASSAWKNITLWNPTTGTLESVFEGHCDTISSMAFSRNGQLASASVDGEIRVWDPVTGVTCRKLESFHGNYVEVVAVAFAPDGTLATSSGRAIQIWNVDTSTVARQMKSSFTVIGLTFLSTGTLALACSSEKLNESKGEIVLYDPETGAKRHTPTIWFERASFSTNDRLALAGKDGKIWVYDLTTGSCLVLKMSCSRVSALAFSFSNESLFVGYYGRSDGFIYHWDLKSRTETFLATCLGGTRSIASSPDSKLAIASSSSKEVWLWDVAPISPSPSPDVGPKIGPPSTIGTRPRLRETNKVKSVVFSQDGKRFASVHSGMICLWDPATQREIRDLETLHAFRGIVLSTSGHRLAFDSTSHMVQVWNTASGRLLQELKGHSARVPAIAFSPDDQVLASGDWNGMVQIWDSNAWHLKTTLSLRKSILSIAFSEKSRRVAFLVGDRGEEIQIWDAQQYIHLQTLRITRQGSKDRYWDLRISFSADGTYIDTDLGRIQLEESPTNSQSEPSPIIKRWVIEDNWLIHDGQKMLWLPHDFRPTCTAIHKDMFVLGHESGKVTIFDGSSHDSTPDPAYDATATDDKSKSR